MFWKWNNSHAIVFLPEPNIHRRPEHANTLTLYQCTRRRSTNSIQHNDRSCELKTIWIENQQRLSSFSPFLWVYFSSFQFDNGLVKEELAILTCIWTLLVHICSCMSFSWYHIQAAIFESVNFFLLSIFLLACISTVLVVWSLFLFICLLLGAIKTKAMICD